MSTMGTVIPGWYAGGVEGEERWWDGARWTAYTRSTVPGAAAANPEIRPLSLDVTNRYWRAREEGSLIGAIVCAILVPPALVSTLFALEYGVVAVVPAIITAALVTGCLRWRSTYFADRAREDALRAQ